VIVGDGVGEHGGQQCRAAHDLGERQDAVGLDGDRRIDAVRSEVVVDVATGGEIKAERGELALPSPSPPSRPRPVRT
jgi:hypothetical protein